MRVAATPRGCSSLPRPQFSVWKQSRNAKDSRIAARERASLRTVFGSHQSADQVSLYEQLANDGGTVRLWSPCVELKASPEEFKSLPFMFYLPGFDGTGIAASRQFESLMNAFEFMAFTFPLDDQSSFTELVDSVVEQITSCVGKNTEGRPIYLLGESFGALIALAAAKECQDSIDRLVLVNPATSYKQSIWPIVGPLIPQIPRELYMGISFSLAPLLGNPLSLISYNVDLSKPLTNQLDKTIEGIVEMVGTFLFIGDVFTPERVSTRLRLVQQGFRFTESLIPKVQQRTLLVVSDGDWMLPSGNEKNRLQGLMRRCYEGGVDLVQILKDEGFYVKERRFTSEKGRQSKLNAFGTALPIELPTEIERQRASAPYTFLDRVTSPVFFSTTSDDMILRGLDGFPEGRPLMIVGNHQLKTVDMFTLINHLVREKGILLRGLAHPLLVDSVTEEAVDRDGGLLLLPIGGQTTINLLSTFGAVRVNFKNLYTLLRHGECILLYPGGARESFKQKKDDAYQLFWPEKSEFVRMAAKFGATIVTLASVGAEEMFDIVMDKNDILRTPLLGNIVRQQIERSPKARTGAEAEATDAFLMPLTRPSGPKRQYFLFGKPFVTTLDHYQDRAKGQHLYAEIKEQLEQNISYLRRKAVDDPYSDFVKRMLYENTNGRGQAPSFDP